MDEYVDTNGVVDQGEINLILKDLYTNGNWEYLYNDQLAADSSVFVWDEDIAFGAGNVLYTLSHESDTSAGNNYHPKTGILFGDTTMGLVLRGLKISVGNDTLTVDTIPQLPTTPTGIISKVIPFEDFRLAIYPNPFRDFTTIEFYIPSNQFTTLKIFDLMGREIATPISQKLSQGSYKTVFESTSLANGIYIVKLVSGNNSKTKKIILQ